MLKRLSLIILIMILSYKTLSDCYLLHLGTHTIARKLNENDTENSIISDFEFVRFKNGPGTVFLETDTIHEKTSLLYAGKTCEYGKVIKVEHRNAKKKYLKVECPRAQFGEWGYAIYSKSRKQVSIPRLLSITPVEEFTKIKEIEEKMKTSLPRKFQLADNFYSERTRYKINSFKHSRLGEKEVYFSVAKGTINLKEPPLINEQSLNFVGKDTEHMREIFFHVAFLVHEGDVWFIADSGSNFCGTGLVSQIKRDSSGIGWSLNRPPQMFHAWDFGEDGLPEMFTLGKPGIFYYANFKKDLIFFENFDPRGSNWDDGSVATSDTAKK
ncbi:MAG: hypothetical protein KAQ98_10025 [Bacteriovoracaceae bacterium]|nr:hypothetical protein [Bacteriovoracaceae bacterium]